MSNIRIGKTALAAVVTSVFVTAWQPNLAASQETGMMKDMMGPGLMVPTMDPARGRQLFASKGCVVCHSVNGVGGEDAPPLDASTMVLPMNPFEFAARMWRGAEAMVAMQREELGEPISLTGTELADIIAFVHDAEAQSQFSKKDIPERIKNLMGNMD
ncbi:c-type cytochrome [Hoeflea sp. AS60]|uniref:c-type cytochrome n=1 Tax=Hoeflea sp. AS60 TaxID=3135780 RepID=UPI003181ABCB